MESLVNIFWLTGSYHMRRLTISDIRKAIGECELFVYGKDTPIEHVLGQTTGCGLFTSNQLIILTDFPVSEGKNKTKNINALITNLDKNCYLIFNGVSTTGVTKIYDEVKKIGKVIDFPQFLDRKKAATWVFNRFRESKKEIEGAEVELILELVGIEGKKGVDVDKLYVCIKKICDYAGPKKDKIEKADVLQSSDQYNNFVIWNIFDSMDKKDLNECIRTIKNACKNDTIKNIVAQILNVSQWRIKMLLLVKELQAKKYTDDQVIKYLLDNLHKLSSGENGHTIDNDASGKQKPLYNTGVLNSAVKGFYDKPATIGRYARRELYRGLACLSESIIESRSSPTETEMLLLADVFFLTMLKPEVPDTYLNKMRRVSYE